MPGLRQIAATHALVPALFVVALILASICHPPGASLVVHAQLGLTLLAFLLVGSAVEALLGLGGSFVFHRIVLGQIALLFWFYLRSITCLSGVPGVGSIELWLVVFALVIASLLRPPTNSNEAVLKNDWLALGLILLLWCAALHWFVGRYSGRLETPTSDTDLHAFLAHLTQLAGHIVTNQLPYAPDATAYPSGFASLNTVWMLLGGTTPVAQIDAQIPLQGCLAVGLILEAGAALRGKLRAAPAIFFLGIAFLFVALPVHPDAAGLDGTARRAGFALLILPLTFSLRARASQLSERTRRACILVVAAVSLAFTFSLNPALLLATPPILLATLLIAGSLLASPWRAWALAIALSTIVIASDAWTRSQFRSRQEAPPAAASSAAAAPLANESNRAANPSSAPRKLSESIARGLRGAAADSALGIFPRGCQSSAQCRADLAPLRDWTPLAFAAALVVFALRRRRDFSLVATRAAALLLSLAGALWLARFVATAANIPPAGLTFWQTLFHRYLQQGLDWSSMLLWLLAIDASLALSAALLEPLLKLKAVRLDSELLASGIALALIAILQSSEPGLAEETLDAIAIDLGAPPESNLGAIEPGDLQFVREIASVIPKGERVLLPGLPASNGIEPAWIYALGTGRAIPLYTSIDFAFFLGLGPEDFTAANYRRHVCRALDLNWLWQRRVRWLIVSPLLARDACVHELGYAATHDFTEAHRTGDRVLLHLREDRLAEAAQDPMLGVPTIEPIHGANGSSPIGELIVRGPIALAGWACDGESSAPVSVELELSDESGQVVHELHTAALATANPDAQTRCGSGPHGFAFAPVAAGPGSYRAKFFAWDGRGKTRALLAEDFSLRLDF